MDFLRSKECEPCGIVEISYYYMYEESSVFFFLIVGVVRSWTASDFRRCPIFDGVRLWMASDFGQRPILDGT